MDLTQRKLTKSEWNSIEIPVSSNELRIIDLIKTGYHDVNAKINYTMTLLRYMKVNNSNIIDLYVYTQYLQSHILSLAKKYDFSVETFETTTSTKMKKADIIRFSNTDKQIADHKMSMFEYVLIDLLEKCFKRKVDKKTSSGAGTGTGKGSLSSENSWMYYYYTIKILLNYNIESLNSYLKQVLIAIMTKLDAEVKMETLILLGYDLIERNEYLLKYADETLYEHQKRLFTICKQPTPKLILYIAPTGTGKTLSPLGLSEVHRVIFVCAARHVGLALAKAAISANKKVAFAFGCSDAEDIRLHYFAAKEYTKNKKSGAIGKVDNSVGDKVEIMISDIKSYLPAMYYMLAFNPKEKIILYWDEPTITLDYETHEFHEIIKNNWSKNIIPNVVLSSATLPQQDEITDTIIDFRSKFDGAEIHEIVSHDCKKTIPIINREGYVEMPHYLFDDYDKILKVTTHCQKYKTLLRYIDLSEAIKFILQVNNTAKAIKSSRYKLERIFLTTESITMANIKTYYLDLLGNLNPEAWSDIYKQLTLGRVIKTISNINIVTTDAYTLTDGPTIFLADDVEKIAQFYIQSANIPEKVIQEIMTTIQFNTTLNEKIAVLEKDLEDGTKKDEGKEKKMNEGRVDPEMKKLMFKIEGLKDNVKSVILNPRYVPNTHDHLFYYTKQQAQAQQAQAQQAQAQQAQQAQQQKQKPFTCEISEQVVEKIMLIDDVADSWKLLLLMGIGVFATHKSDRYTEIMKSLAIDQKLYLIIASSDYIYGTNYQFCHGYIGKDLGTMSQEKCIQSMGRVGRNKIQQDYSVRFRDNVLIWKLFQTEENKPEVRNMSLLFTSDI